MLMRNRWIAVMIAIATAAVAPRVLPVVTAQAAPDAPAYVPLRTADGHPDLNGVWRAWNLAKFDLEAHGARPGVPGGLGFVLDPADGKIPYQDWALKQRELNYQHTRSADPYENADPLAKCYLPGIPRLTYLGWPFQIMQEAERVYFQYEWGHKNRVVPTTDVGPRPDPEGGLNARWNGIPRGRYEGNSLVVDIANFHGFTWFDMAGNFHSNALHVVERYTPVGPDTLQYEATMEDPQVFTRPWTIRMVLQRQKDVGLLDYECTAMLDELGIHHTWPRDFDVPRDWDVPRPGAGNGQ
jgi:hypothetical protein